MSVLDEEVERMYREIMALPTVEELAEAERLRDEADPEHPDGNAEEHPDEE